MRRLLLAAGLCVGLVGPSFADPAVTSAWSNMRRAPSAHSRIVQSVPANAQIDLQNCTGEWCFASWRNISGYIPAFAVAEGALRRLSPWRPPRRRSSSRRRSTSPRPIDGVGPMSASAGATAGVTGRRAPCRCRGWRAQEGETDRRRIANRRRSKVPHRVSAMPMASNGGGERSAACPPQRAPLPASAGADANSSASTVAREAQATQQDGEGGASTRLPATTNASFRG